MKKRISPTKTAFCAAELETEFAELGGWEAESDASRMLQGLGITRGGSLKSAWPTLDGRQTR